MGSPVSFFAVFLRQNRCLSVRFQLIDDVYDRIRYVFNRFLHGVIGEFELVLLGRPGEAE
jgi:hypothetical protein